ncbi:protein kintoun-like [Montipora capricornis]|uniref:protein kintoun-like n=1 Tax=Montipora capricornis TaxID=246305 RepID=UPI0035F1A3B0
MSQTSNEKDFKMTKEELDKFEKAMKDEEFRKLLAEYAKEISDPENKKKYEEEITQMEKMKGMDIKFVNPEDGYVVKTTDCSSGVKAFINICSNQHIAKASSQYVNREENGKKKSGHQWHIPYSLSPPRDDIDRAGKKCVVYDAVFHPDTYNKGQEDKRFKQLMIDTAIDGILREFKATLDKKSLKFPKMKFKGVKTATVIRSKSTEAPVESAELTIGGQTFPYPYDDNPTTLNAKEKQTKQKKGKNSKTATSTDPTVPEYRLVHRGHIDFQNFTNARDANANTRPKELVLYIDLPKLESAAPVDLDIMEKQLLLNCNSPRYHLDLALPYPVDDENGSAKFDKSKRRLIVTLPVLPSPMPCFLEQTGEIVDEGEATDSVTGVENSQNIIEISSTSSKGDFSGTPVENIEMSSAETDISSKHDNQQQLESEVADDLDIRFKIPNSSMDFSSPCFFTCPPYSYHQDNDVITFVIDVPNIALESISLGFNKNKAYISFPSGTPKPGELPSPDFTLYLQFPEEHDLDTELCNIDVSKENLVLTLRKLDACKGVWDSFQAGSGEENLETKFFITEDTVGLMMKEIAEQDPWASTNAEASVKVVSVTDDCLSLEVETTCSDDLNNVESNTEHVGVNFTSCEESATDLMDESQKNKPDSSNLHESNEAKCENQKKESVSLDPEVMNTSAEKRDDFVPIDVINNAMRTRKSILRRTSSTSTDDSQGEELEFNGTPESPSKNVRFNLNPNVRVFSNKKGKGKRKLEAKLKAEARKYSQESEGSSSEQTNGTSPVESGTEFNGLREKSLDSVDVKKEKVQGIKNEGSEINGTDDLSGESAVSSASDHKSFGLTNNLIFELDD